MTMFRELFDLACDVTLTMTISADQGTERMTINVVPRPTDDAKEPALAQPLSLTATPQEFDGGFVEALRGYREVRLSLVQQAQATQAALEAARAASVKKASEASKSKTVRAATGQSTPVDATPKAAAAEGSDAQDGSADCPAAPEVAATPTGRSYDLFA